MVDVKKSEFLQKCKLVLQKLAEYDDIKLAEDDVYVIGEEVLELKAGTYVKDMPKDTYVKCLRVMYALDKGKACGKIDNVDIEKLLSGLLHLIPVDFKELNECMGIIKEDKYV